MQNIVDAIFGVISEGVTQFTTLVTSAITSLVGVFYDATTHTLTFLGIVAILGVSVMLVWAIIRLIRGSLRLGAGA